MKDIRIELEEHPAHEEKQVLVEGLLEHYVSEYGDPDFTPIALFLRNEAGDVCGGLTARIRWGWLYVEVLWIARGYRASGYGSRLLERAEEFAYSRGGVAAHLEAGGDHLLSFYQKRGYEIVGRMDGFPPGEEQYFLRKWLTGREDAQEDAFA